MQQTSSNYKNEIKQPSRHFECRVTIGKNIYTNESIVDIIFDYPQAIDGFSIGNTTSQSLDLTLLNTGEEIYSTNQIKVEIGLRVGSDFEYILMGYYNVDEVSKNDYTIKFTAFDNMMKFETPYFSSLGDKSTLQQVINELATITGVSFTGSVPSYTVTKLDGYTCREVLSYVASLCGGNALITRDGKFTIKTLQVVDCSVTIENHFGLTTEEIPYKLGKITCVVDDESELSKGATGTDSMELSFENPWMTEGILNTLYQQLKGFSYLGFQTKWQGDLALDPYDLILIQDKKGTSHQVPILNQKFTYVGGLTSEIAAKGESKNKNSFSSSGPNANKTNRLVTEQAIIKEALINKANIQDLEAVSIRTQSLEATTVKIQDAIIDVAHISDLNAVNAKIEALQATDVTIQNAIINKADISELNAAVANINILNADLGVIKHLVNGNLSSENIQAGGITSDKLTIANGFIKDAMIDSLNANKITAGQINTALVQVSSASGNLVINDNTIQIRDANRVRVQIGKDASNDYSMSVWDSSGQLMFDARGLKANAIKDSIIRNDMISADANIDGSKLNISSVVSSINNSSSTLKASKVQFDGIAQTLEVAFNALKTQADATKTQTESNTTAISVAQGQIKTLIQDTTITKDGVTTTLKDEYSRLEQTVSGLNSTIGKQQTIIDDHSGKITSTNSELSTLKQSVNGLSASISSAQTTINSHTTLINQKADLTAVNDKINSAKNELNTSINKKANAVDVYNKTETYTKAQTDSAIKVAKDEINLGVSGTYETKTNVETKVSSTLNSAKSYADAKKTEAINTASTDATNKVNSAKTELNTAINKKANSADVYTKTQVYTKDETNSQINIAKEAINLGVSQTYETKTNVETKVSNAVVEARRITDTRSTNQNPQWYMTNYPKQTISEFKLANIIGIPNASTNYGTLTTNTPWTNASGSYPVQTFKSSNYKTYERRGTSLTNWGGWVQVENAIDSQTKANTAKQEAITTANNTLTTTIANYYTKEETNSQINIAKDAINLGVSNTYETKTNVESKVSSTLNSAKSYADTKKTEAINAASTDATNKVNSAKTELNTAINKKANSADVYTKTQVYTKDETNSQINIAKEAINLGVSNTYETKANVTTKVSNAVAEARGITDTRNTNQNPQWYMTNYPRQTISEFKYANVIGIPGAYQNYGTLTTNTPWADASGSYPVQTFKSSNYKTYERRGTSLTSWGGWVQIENTIDSQTKANTAKQEAITSANNTLTTTIANYYTKAQTDSQINVAKNAITSSVSSTYETKTDSTTKYDTATAIAKAMNSGKIIHEDIAFRNGNNGLSLYNNAGNGNVKVERITKPSDCPTTSTHCMRVTTTGTASPGWGGFYQGISSRANAVFIQKIVAKVPTGYQLNVASNSMGTGYTDKWLTSNKGTGKWETYIRQVTCGSSGTFSGGGHVYASGGATPTASAPLVWYVASCTAIDITDTDERVSSLTTRMSTAESKITDSSITNVVKQNFYTKTETENAITSKGYATQSQVQQTAENIEFKFTQSGGYNLIRNGNPKPSREEHWWVSSNGWWHRDNPGDLGIRTNDTNEAYAGCATFKVQPGKTYSLSCWLMAETNTKGADVYFIGSANDDGAYTEVHHLYGGSGDGQWVNVKATFTLGSNINYGFVRIDNNGRKDTSIDWNTVVFFGEVQMVKGSEYYPQWSPNPNEVYDGVTSIDKEGITVTASNVRSKTKMSADGFQLIRTTDNKKMFYVNQDGSLEMSGNFTQYDTNGKISIKIANNSYGCYDWLWDGDFVGNLGAFESNRTNTSGANQRFIGIANIADYGNQLVLGVRSSPNSTNFNTYMEIDNTGIMHRDYVTFTANAGFKTNAIFRNPSNNNNETGRIFGATNDHFFVACNYHNQLRLGYEKNGSYYSGMSIYRNDNTSAGCAIEYYADEVHHNNVVIEGFLSVKGQKNRLVATENFGDRLLNAYETAECYFGDINEAIIGEDGEVKVELDEVFLETVNTTETYHVFLTKYGEGDCYVSERHEKYFVIKGTPNLSVGFEVKAKQRGYEKERLKMTVDTLKSHQAMSYSPCSEDEAGYTIDCETTINRA